MKRCKRCGKPFPEGTHGGRLFCSARCWQRKDKNIVCVNCRESLPSRRQKYCDRCKPYAEKARWRVINRRKGHTAKFFKKYPAGRACPTCKKLYSISEFPFRNIGNGKRSRRWECKSCRNDRVKTNRPKPETQHLICPECNKAFATTHPTQKYCSVRCGEITRYKGSYIPKRQNKLFPLLEFSVCTRCGSSGEKYKGSSWCKECDKAYSREWRKNMTPEEREAGLAKLLAWKLANPERAKMSRGKRGYSVGKGDTLTQREWDLILEYFGYRCAYCDAEGELQRDHVVPYSKGGRLALENVVPACSECNGHQGKHDNDMRSWLNDEQRHEFILTTMGDIEYEMRHLPAYQG